MSYITIVANEPYHCISGGIPRFLKEIAPRLAQHYCVKLLVIGDGLKLKVEKPFPTLEIYHFPHYDLPVGDAYPPKFIPKEVKKIIAGSDLVFIQTVDCLVPLYYTLKYKKPLVMYFHGIDWETFPRAIGYPRIGRLIAPLVKAYARFWYNKSARLLIPSGQMEKVLGDAKISVTKNIVPLGINHRRFIPSQSKALAKEALGFSPLDLVIGYTGRLAREKNISFLLQSFENLQKTHPNLKLLLVGMGVKDFQHRIDQNPNIKAVGQSNDVVSHLQAMDIFCMPSTTETSSLSSMEAMSCGVPVVAYRVGCLSEYLHHERNGFLTPLNDEVSYQKNIERLINDRSLREEMGRQARDTITSRYSWDDTVQLMVNSFDGLLERKAGTDLRRASASQV